MFRESNIIQSITYWVMLWKNIKTFLCFILSIKINHQWNSCIECNMLDINPSVLLNRFSICKYVLVNLHVHIDLTFHIYIKFRNALYFKMLLSNRLLFYLKYTNGYDSYYLDKTTLTNIWEKTKIRGQK